MDIQTVCYASVMTVFDKSCCSCDIFLLRQGQQGLSRAVYTSTVDIAK